MCPDEQYMAEALKLARKGLGKTRPNPPVGCVIVKDGQVIGRGYHHKAGGAHAEINALRKAGAQSQGASLYVTLEPCSTSGKTGPCTEAIIKAGIAKVYIGAYDPGKANGHKALKVLKKAGIEVIPKILHKACEQLIAPFSTFIKHKRAYVSLKVAMSLDGRIACDNGKSQWITNSQSRKYVHQLRSEVDAILVGNRTLHYDNPRLTVRLPGKNTDQPYKVVWVSDGQLKSHLNVLKQEADKTIVVSLVPISEELIDLGVHNVVLQGASPESMIKELLKILAKQFNIMHLLVEGGAETYKHFVQSRLADQMFCFVAPKFLGGSSLFLPSDCASPSSVSSALQLKDIEIERFKDDTLIRGCF